MKASKKFIFTIILLTILLFAFRIVDNGFLLVIKEKLDAYNKSFPLEKVYLQFDKPLYKPGEDIWFNAFLFNGLTTSPSPISNVLYVELIDPKGNLVKKLDLFVEEGTAHGDFALEKNLPGGLYTIRSYTRWMQNFSEENYFLRNILVQNLITPRLLLKLDFEKKAYGISDVVIAKLQGRNLKDEPLSVADIHAQINLDGNKWESKTFKMDTNGEAQLSFTLPNNLNTTDGLIQAIVSSGGVEESIVRSVPIVLNQIQLQFFPEGGDLVAGTTSKVAFKATNEFGKGADVAGVIVNEEGKEIVSFESFHFGMGAFDLTAESGMKYFARLVKHQGISQTFALPIVQPPALSLSVKQLSDTLLQIRIYSPTSTMGFLIGQVHSQIDYAEKLILKEGDNFFPISTTSMPAGIAVFTLFNSDGVETCERLVFVNYHRKLKVELFTDRQEYLPGEKVKVTIKSSDYKGNPLPSKFSIAVVDDQLISAIDDKQDNLLTWMLLSSELKGKIEEPSFYFNENEPKAKQSIDYLLLVHGWRRFTWKEVYQSSTTISYLPENDKTISGLTLDNRGRKIKAEVILMELGNRRRLAKVKSTEDGQFLFKNTDVSIPVILLTKKPNTILADGFKSASARKTQPANYYPSQSEWIEPVMEINDQGNGSIINDKIIPTGNEMDVDLSADVSQLSEVIVTGYGVSSEKKALGYSISTIYSNQITGALSNSSIDQLLAGRVSGIQMTQATNPGSSANIRIRGIGSLGNRGEPLWVIDGVPFTGSLNQNFPVGLQLGPENINNIHVIKSPEATALFGGIAANGVILVETKSKLDFSDFRYVRRDPKYSFFTINPREFSPVREFYTDPPSRNDGSRNNFKTTVWWQHTVVTDKSGKAEISFYNNDATSTFRITAEGFSGNGLIGRNEKSYHTLLPFSLDAKLPDYLGYEDTLMVPVRITNNTHTKLNGKLMVTLPGQLQSLEMLKKDIEVDEGESVIIPVPIIPKGVAGSFPLSIRLESSRYKDEISHTLNVQPVGFPVRLSFSGKNSEKSITFKMTDIERGSIKGEIVVIPDVLQDLFTGAEAMLREPHGCFEQVSSSTFPNILALQLLKEIGKRDPQIQKKAMDFIGTGYKMLKSYEIPSGGFEWFGHPPAHEGLTAFGLIEFHEMKKVFNQVDEQLIERTKNWILNRRRGDGTFKQDRGKYGFSAAPEEVNNAYIVYALSETGVNGVDLEYRHGFAEAMNSKDMYRAALMANAAINFGKTDDFRALEKMFVAAVREKGLHGLGIKSSIVCSYGNSLVNETVSLWALALMKSSNPDYKLVTECVNFIGSKKSFGMYGSTQATYLSLKAITVYHQLMVSGKSDGEVSVVTQNNFPETKSFTRELKENIVFSQFVTQLKEGENHVSIRFNKTDEPLPYAFNLQWNTKTPQNSGDCKLRIETQLRKSEIKINQTVRLTVKLSNVTDQGIPMSMAVVGIPAGLSIQPWQLKELKEKEVFDFYEILGNKLAIYYRELGPKELKEINLDLKAEVPGTFLSIASCAYLYYGDEFRHWVEGSRIKVIR